MSDVDTNGIKVKPGHSGNEGPAIGPVVWLSIRHDGKMFGPFKSRHDAVAHKVRCERLSADDYRVKPIRAGSFRFDDVVVRGGEQ